MLIAEASSSWNRKERREAGYPPVIPKCNTIYFPFLAALED